MALMASWSSVLTGDTRADEQRFAHSICHVPLCPFIHSGGLMCTTDLEISQIKIIYILLKYIRKSWQERSWPSEYKSHSYECMNEGKQCLFCSWTFCPNKRTQNFFSHHLTRHKVHNTSQGFIFLLLLTTGQSGQQQLKHLRPFCSEGMSSLSWRRSPSMIRRKWEHTARTECPGIMDREKVEDPYMTGGGGKDQTAKDKWVEGQQSVIESVCVPPSRSSCPKVLTISTVFLLQCSRRWWWWWSWLQVNECIQEITSSSQSQQA